MSVINYRLSDGAKFNALWSLLNTNYNAENDWAVDYDICEVYDDYALCKNYAENCFERVYYKKNDDDEDESVSISEKKKCYIIDVTEEEYTALNALRKACGSFELVNENYTNALSQVESLTQEKAEFATKIEEYTTQISTLTTEKEEINTQYEAANTLLNETKETLEGVQASLATLQAEHDSLVEYKKGVETAEKQTVIDSYAEMLSEETLTSYREKIDEYSAQDLDMHLAYELKQSNPSVFSKAPEQVVIPKGTQISSLEEALSKYVK